MSNSYTEEEQNVMNLLGEYKKKYYPPTTQSSEMNLTIVDICLSIFSFSPLFRATSVSEIEVLEEVQRTIVMLLNLIEDQQEILDDEVLHTCRNNLEMINLKVIQKIVQLRDQ